MRAARVVALVAALAGPSTFAACSHGSSPLALRFDEGSDAGAMDEDAADDAPTDVSADTHRDVAPMFDAAEETESGDGAPADVAPDVYVDPDGTPVLLFANGVVDRDGVQLCLVPWKGDAATGTPAVFPDAPLAFGKVATVGVPSSFATADVRVFVVAAPATCNDLSADAPDGGAIAALSVLPAGTLAAKRALLLVAAGCLGGVVLADPLDACGDTYSVDAGAPRMALFQVARMPPPLGTIGLQAANGSAVLGDVSVYVSSSEGATATIGKPIDFGEVTPLPPAFADPATLLGSSPDKATASILVTQGSTSLGPFPETVATSALHANAAILLLVLGGKPQQSGDGGAGNAPTIAWISVPML